ncbi:hypothetical protein HPP92_009451 [Vanilla planifolia]|uniref:Uncharacterized protein n=1 Tax=Vanilla planifolia TaxID=51239 RepID=A0A835R7U5_VANPL|nr:hypothetical protein HPP92_009451 [Vanilla planifolia]
MAKYADKLIKHLEGISGRLTQLELCCYKLERSVGEFRADMIRDQSEADLRMKSLVKRIHEVHRSVQIIRDKQELYETHKELANLRSHQRNQLIHPTPRKAQRDSKHLLLQRMKLTAMATTCSPFHTNQFDTS